MTVDYDRKASEDEILSTPRGVFDRKVNAKHREAGPGGWFAEPGAMDALWAESVIEAAEYRANKSRPQAADGAWTTTGPKEVRWACRRCGAENRPMVRGSNSGEMFCFGGCPEQ